MKRGVISLTKSEANELAQVIETSQKLENLKSKLNAGQAQDGEVINIQTNEEEAESILDEIGPPIGESSQDRSSLRNKVQSFLQKLRGR